MQAFDRVYDLAGRGLSALQGKGADLLTSEYLKGVNAALSQKASVRYSEIYRSLHGDMEALRDALDRGVAAEVFAERTIVDFGLVRNGGDFDPELISGFNKTQSAICEFAMNSHEWRLSPDGWVYREEVDGLASLRPIKVKDSSEFGFGTFVHDGARLGPDGRAIDRKVGEPISGQMDIGEAVSEYHLRRGSNLEMKIR